MRVLLIFLHTKTLNCCNKRKHNVILELHTEKNCENQKIRGGSRSFWWGVDDTNRPSNYTLIYSKLSYFCPKTWRIRKDNGWLASEGFRDPRISVCFSMYYIFIVGCSKGGGGGLKRNPPPVDPPMKTDRQLVMSRTSSKEERGRLRLSYKNPDFFGTFIELYRIFQKWRSLWGLMEGIFINFNICLYVAQKTTPARNNSRMTTLAPLIDAKGHFFELFSSQLRGVLSMNRCYKLLLLWDAS